MDDMNSRNFPLSHETKKQILEALFNDSSNSIEADNLVAASHSYFRYFQRFVERTRANSLIDSHLQLCNLATLLKARSSARSSIKQKMQDRLNENEREDSEEIVDYSLSLAVRILIMVPTGCFSPAGRSITLSGETKLSWNDGTLNDFIKKEFSVQRHLQIPVKLEKTFNATNLEHIAGIEVRWTCNFADHLRMRDDDKTVEIFHYASFLRLHQNRYDDHG